MKYKDCEIMANTKSYSLWSVDDEGRLNDLEHEFEGHDIISYTFKSEKYGVLDGDYGDWQTIEEVKKAIDNLVKQKATEHNKQVLDGFFNKL